MKFKEYLQEIFSPERVYVNPNIKKLKEIFDKVNGVRFIIDYKAKKFFVWSAKMFHVQAVKEIFDTYSDDNRGRAWAWRANKLCKLEMDKNFPAVEKTWLSKYMDVEDIDFIHEENLSEEYYKRINRGKESFEIFKNPSRKELFKLFKEIPTSSGKLSAMAGGNNSLTNLRGLIDKDTDDIYIFSEDCLHWDVAPIINSNADDDNYEEFFWTLVLAKNKDMILWDTLASLREKDINIVTKLLQSKFGRVKYSVNLNEEYIGTTKEFEGKTEIFKNPSKREMSECGPNIRFIADLKNKNLYIANAHKCIHNNILNVIRREDNPDFSNDVFNDKKFWKTNFAGFAKLVIGKLELTHHAEGCGEHLQWYFNILKEFDDSWLKQWFNDKNPIKNFKNIEGYD